MFGMVGNGSAAIAACLLLAACDDRTRQDVKSATVIRPQATQSTSRQPKAYPGQIIRFGKPRVGCPSLLLLEELETAQDTGENAKVKQMFGKGKCAMLVPGIDFKVLSIARDLDPNEPITVEVTAAEDAPSINAMFAVWDPVK